MKSETENTKIKKIQRDINGKSIIIGQIPLFQQKSLTDKSVGTRCKYCITDVSDVSDVRGAFSIYSYFT